MVSSGSCSLEVIELWTAERGPRLPVPLKTESCGTLNLLHSVSWTTFEPLPLPFFLPTTLTLAAVVVTKQY